MKMLKKEWANGFQTNLVWRGSWRYWVYRHLHRKDSPVYAKAVVSKFFEKVEILRTNPELGRTVPETNDKKIREMYIYSYRLIYKIDIDTILLVAVVHGKRLLENHN